MGNFISLKYYYEKARNLKVISINSIDYPGVSFFTFTVVNKLYWLPSCLVFFFYGRQ